MKLKLIADSKQVVLTFPLSISPVNRTMLRVCLQNVGTGHLFGQRSEPFRPQCPGSAACQPRDGQGEPVSTLFAPRAAGPGGLAQAPRNIGGWFPHAGAAKPGWQLSPQGIQLWHPLRPPRPSDGPAAIFLGSGGVVWGSLLSGFGPACCQSEYQ